MAHPIQVFAHRGACQAAPENTLPAFDTALAMGVDGIELDVHCSKDGHLVVIHDFDVAKTTNGTGLVGSYTAAELAELDAGSHFDARFAGVGVPTLAQVLDLTQDRCIVNIEIKSRELSGGNQVQPLVEMIQARNLHEQVIVSSFNPITLLKVRLADKTIPLGLLYTNQMPLFLRRAWARTIVRPVAMHPHHTMIDAAYMAWAREKGYRVNTWTVNDADEVRRLSALSVDAILTDAPDRIIAALKTAPAAPGNA